MSRDNVFSFKLNKSYREIVGFHLFCNEKKVKKFVSLVIKVNIDYVLERYIIDPGDRYVHNDRNNLGNLTWKSPTGVI